MMLINRRLFGALAASALIGAGCAALAAGHATTHTVEIRGMAFAPAQLTIKAGDTVVFVNRDRAPHTATGRGGTFDSGRLRRGDQAALTFTSAGTYDYFCEVHPRMTAQIVVEQ